jgi:hypothetical protein
MGVEACREFETKYTADENARQLQRIYEIALASYGNLGDHPPGGH